MSRPAKGAVIERRGTNGTRYAIRFTAYGERRFETIDATSRQEAEAELANRLADVRRGIWKPRPAEPAPVPTDEPTFWEFAREWLKAREAEELAPKTIADLRWSLNKHLIWFGRHQLSEITVQEVDRYKTAKAEERKEVEADLAEWLEADPKTRGPRPRPLSNASINHTLRHLAQILETAVEYGKIPSNPATGKRRRLKTTRPSRPWVEPEQLMVLLDAAKTDDGKAGVGRVLLGLLAGTGVRIGEALSLRWSDCDLGTGTMHVRESKTEKGVRRVDLSPALREELTIWKADAKYTKPTDFVIHTSTGRKHNPSNLRRDVLAPAVTSANAVLDTAGIATIPDVTFHSLRRTYATVQRFLETPDYVADQLGHEDSRFTDRIYRQTPKNRRDRLSPAHRKAFDRAIEWARIGPVESAQNGTNDDLAVAALQTEATKNPA